MNHDPFEWGRPSDAVFGAYNTKIANASPYPSMHTQQPIVTGTSVISMKYNGGVIIAADSLGSYGSLLRFTDLERLIPVGKDTVVGISGDVSDMQHLEYLLEEMQTENNYDNQYAEDEEALKPSYVFEYLANVMYSRRSKMNPLWNALIVAGVEDDKPFLKYVNLLGVSYSAPSLATGFGAHLALPLLRKVVDTENDVANTSLETAQKSITEAMKVLFYRDARSSRKYSVAIVDKEKGLIFDKDAKVEDMVWGFAKDIKGYGTQKV
ncbi:LANO_0D00562g1_1 [Lachancea nothofagi CBS 11611]|uniref:Proteasome subunit beta n=1 Tax=Lachancea nothofagi CBS 11611 TaxID=1266666 RepID=A0A1G4JCZ0_9SACH|nr:LANO_0D00562g1_1 [Lachancea nothofagi CBS 11611]